MTHDEFVGLVAEVKTHDDLSYLWSLTDGACKDLGPSVLIAHLREVSSKFLLRLDQVQRKHMAWYITAIPVGLSWLGEGPGNTEGIRAWLSQPCPVCGFSKVFSTMGETESAFSTTAMRRRNKAAGKGLFA